MFGGNTKYYYLSTMLNENTKIMKTLELTFLDESIRLFDSFLASDLSISEGDFRKIITKTSKGALKAIYHFEGTPEELYRLGYDWANYQRKK